MPAEAPFPAARLLPRSSMVAMIAARGGARHRARGGGAARRQRLQRPGAAAGGLSQTVTREHNGKPERVMVLTGIDSIPVRRRLRSDPIPGGVRRDFPGPPPDCRDPQRAVRLDHQPHYRRSDGVRYPAEDRRVLQRLRPGVARRQGRSQLFRDAGARRDVSRQGDPQDRPDKVPSRRRRLHDLCATDAALGDRVGFRDGGAGRLRADEELGAARQGRAADVLADLLLSDRGRRPLDRVPDADVRHVDAARAIAHQCVLLGDQSQPGRDP